MPHSYLQDLKRTVNALSTDDTLVLEERLILLGLITEYIDEVRKGLEIESAGQNGDRS